MDQTPDNAPIIHGLHAELLVAMRLTNINAIVSMPLTHIVRYDLIVDCGGHLTRVQVKKARWRPQRIKPQGRGDRAGYEIPLGLNRTIDLSGKRRRYTIDDFDILAAVCDAKTIYFIPIHELLCKSGERAGQLQLYVLIKPEATDTGRADSREATARWEQFRENLSCFQLPVPKKA